MTFLKKLSKREKLFLGGGIVLVGGMVVYLYLIDPLRERAVILNHRIPETEAALTTFSGLSEEYRFLSTHAQQVESRLPGKNQFSPLSYIERTAVQNKVRGKITSIRAISSMPQGVYQEIPMEVKMESLSVSEMVPFLAAFEEAPYFLRMKRLSVKTRQDDSGTLDITFVLSFYEKT